MKLVCPSCGALMSLDVIMNHDGAREAVQTALQLPAPLGNLLVQYLTLFRPAQRQLTLERVAGILGELLPMIQSGRIHRDGREVAIAQAVWAAGLQEIMDKHKTSPLKTPLKSHGYLLEILINKAGSMEAKAEARREERRRQPPAAEQARRSSGMKSASEHMANMKKALAGTLEPEFSFAELTEMAKQKERERNQQREAENE